jgi:hypothetical protein
MFLAFFMFGCVASSSRRHIYLDFWSLQAPASTILKCALRTIGILHIHTTQFLGESSTSFIMGHDAHHHEEKQSLSFFASPLAYAQTLTADYEMSSRMDVEQQQKTGHNASIASNMSSPGFKNMDYSLHDNPAFHRHAEATTAELFYDLFFVANLTTFTSMLEINDHKSLTAYIGFFSLLWLTWYQVSLYDVRFSADSVFERVAKTVHFGVMVGFAVIGPQWKPGQEISDYKIYKSFGLMLMVSRLTLFCQYGVTLFYTKRYKKTIIPMGMIMASTLLAASLYGALTPTFPKEIFDAQGLELPQKSHVYIAWYIIAISETILTVTVSCHWRIISFKGTHMVQRMSLLTLIILGEGIIVICKSMSKIVKNEYLWTFSVVGQIVAGESFCIFTKRLLHADHPQPSSPSTFSICSTSIVYKKSTSAPSNNRPGRSCTSLCISPLFSSSKAFRFSSFGAKLSYHLTRYMLTGRLRCSGL